MKYQHVGHQTYEKHMEYQHFGHPTYEKVMEYQHFGHQTYDISMEYQHFEHHTYEKPMEYQHFGHQTHEKLMEYQHFGHFGHRPVHSHPQPTALPPFPLRPETSKNGPRASMTRLTLRRTLRRPCADLEPGMDTWENSSRRAVVVAIAPRG